MLRVNDIFKLIGRINVSIIFLGPHKFPDFDSKIQRLRDMGISEYEARAALSRNNWDLTRATEQLFS